MPLNGSGTYTPPSPQFPATPNTLILASDYNAVINDISNALSQAVFRDGQGAFTGNQSMGGFKLTNMAVGTADTDSVRKGQLLDLFPIGAIYLTANNTNPGTFLGGTWAQIAQGRTLIGVGTLGSDTYTAGAEGGEARVTLTTTEMPSHNHGGMTGGQSASHSHDGITGGDGAHSHNVIFQDGKSLSSVAGSGDRRVADGQLYGAYSNYLVTTENGAHQHSFTTNGASVDHWHSVPPQGGGGAHENRMPYLAVYFWQRTA